MDAVVDRLSHAEVVQFGAMLLQPASASFRRTDLGRRVVSSMTRSGVMDVKRRRIRSPYDQPGTARCVDDESSTLVACADDGDPGGSPSADAGGLLLAVMKPMARGTTCAFKIIGAGDNSEGFVCYQTSTLTADDLTRLVRLVIQGGKAAGNKDGNVRRNDTNKKNPVGKRVLCDVYEIAIRAFRPSGILRPLRGRLYLKRGGVKGVN